ncbi:MAG: EamA family transporter [Actinomycetota bacterium]
MTIALGLVFSVGVGIADFLGGWIARRAPALATVATAMVASLAVMVTLLVGLEAADVVSSRAGGSDLLLGLGSGSMIGFGLAALYRGIADASAAVVSPVASILAVLLPFGWDLATGGSLESLALAGAAVALAGVGLTTVSPELGDRVRVGVVWGVVAGIGFGGALTFLGQTSEDAGVFPAMIQRVTALAVLVAVARARRLPALVPPDLRRAAIASGTLSAVAVAAFTVGAQQGSLAEIAITTALAPAITAGLAAVYAGDPFRWWQMIGAAVCCAGVAMVGAA